MSEFLRALHYQERSRKYYLEIERHRERMTEHPQVFGNEVIIDQKGHRHTSSMARGALFEILRRQSIARKPE